MREPFEPICGVRDAAGLVVLVVAGLWVVAAEPVALVVGAAHDVLGAVAGAGLAGCVGGGALRRGTSAYQWRVAGLGLVLHGGSLILAAGRGDIGAVLAVAAVLFGLGSAYLLAVRNPDRLPDGVGFGGFPSS